MPGRGRPLVVVVSGSSGAGKSSLVESLASALRGLGTGVATLHFDDYTDVPDLPGGDVAGWVARGAAPGEWRTPAMDEALGRLLAPEQQQDPMSAAPAVVLVEEPFGRSRPPFDSEADLSVHLRLPPQTALARRLLRELVPADGGLDAAGVSRLRHHLTRFLAEGDALYDAVETSALAGADLVLDARVPQEALTRRALDGVRVRLSEHQSPPARTTSSRA